MTDSKLTDDQIDAFLSGLRDLIISARSNVSITFTNGTTSTCDASGFEIREPDCSFDVSIRGHKDVRSKHTLDGADSLEATAEKPNET